MLENQTVQNKKHVYFMPGMAANPSIFDNIDLPGKLSKNISWIGQFPIRILALRIMP